MELNQKKIQVQELATQLLGEQKPTCFTCSFQAEDVVVLHYLIEQAPNIPVLFLETGYHFPETYAYRDALTKQYNLNLINLTAAKSVQEQESEFGILYQTAPDRCCKLRKVEPLFAALENYEIWFTGLRREQSPTRANLQVSESFTLPTGKELRKISLLADWTNREVWAVAKEKGIPLLPLYDKGYTSIGCAPCTALPLDPNNPRSGRWAGKDSGQKLECGIHISPVGTAAHS